jgi:hypothetical protein
MNKYYYSISLIVIIILGGWFRSLYEDSSDDFFGFLVLGCYLVMGIITYYYSRSYKKSNINSVILAVLMVLPLAFLKWVVIIYLLTLKNTNLDIDIPKSKKSVEEKRPSEMPKYLEKKKGINGKYNTKFGVVGFVVTAIILLYFLILGRYEITGTNKGFVYKTDRFTGNTTIVSQNGEVIPQTPVYKKSTATPTIRKFPIEQLVIINNEIVKNDILKNNNLKLSVKNNYSSTAGNIVVRITLHKEQKSPSYDTRYETTFAVIKPNDTVEISIPMYNYYDSFWYTVQVYSADIW